MTKVQHIFDQTIAPSVTMRLTMLVKWPFVSKAATNPFTQTVSKSIKTIKTDLADYQRVRAVVRSLYMTRCGCKVDSQVYCHHPILLFCFFVAWKQKINLASFLYAFHAITQTASRAQSFQHVSKSSKWFHLCNVSRALLLCVFTTKTNHLTLAQGRVFWFRKPTFHRLFTKTDELKICMLYGQCGDVVLLDPIYMRFPFLLEIFAK